MQIEYDGEYLELNGRKIVIPWDVVAQIDKAVNIFDVDDDDECFYRVDLEEERGYKTCNAWDYKDDDRREAYGLLCRSLGITKRRGLTARLYMLLDRFTRENGWNDSMLSGEQNAKYSLFFRNGVPAIMAEETSVVRPMQVYFVSATIAQRAYDEVVRPFLKEHPDYEL